MPEPVTSTIKCWVDGCPNPPTTPGGLCGPHRARLGARCERLIRVEDTIRVDHADDEPA